MIVINREKINLIKSKVSSPWPDTATVACIFPTHDEPDGPSCVGKIHVTAAVSGQGNDTSNFIKFIFLYRF